MPKISEEQVEKLKAANPTIELHKISADEWDEDIVVRVPTEELWRQWKANIDPATRYGAMKDLINGCLIFPTPVELQAVFGRRPALVEEFTDGVCRIAGVIKSVRLKKL